MGGMSIRSKRHATGTGGREWITLCRGLFAVVLLAASCKAGLDCLPKLHVEGKWVKDEAGNNVSLRGTNCYIPISEIKSAESIRGFVDRVASTDDPAYGNGTVIRLAYYAYGGLEDGDFEYGYNTYIRPAVDRAREKGVYCIVEPHHFPFKEDYAQNRFGSVEKQIQWHVDFWHYMAPRLKDEPHVLFGCANESFGDCATKIRPWILSLAEIIRSYDTDADNIIILQGGGEWGNDITCYIDNLVDMPNVMYERHKYGRYDKLEDFERLMEQAPCILGEWHYLGPHGATGNKSRPLSEWEDYFLQHPNLWSTVWRYHDKTKDDAFNATFKKINVDLPQCGSVGTARAERHAVRKGPRTSGESSTLKAYTPTGRRLNGVGTPLGRHHAGGITIHETATGALRIIVDQSR